MSSGDETTEVAVPAESGECASCRHARALRSRRGSTFVLCRRAALDARFARYPRLPMRGCRGYEPPAT
jgi:hypothetical protein